MYSKCTRYHHLTYGYGTSADCLRLLFWSLILEVLIIKEKICAFSLASRESSVMVSQMEYLMVFKLINKFVSVLAYSLSTWWRLAIMPYFPVCLLLLWDVMASNINPHAPTSLYSLHSFLHSSMVLLPYLVWVTHQVTYTLQIAIKLLLDHIIAGSNWAYCHSNV